MSKTTDSTLAKGLIAREIVEFSSAEDLGAFLSEATSADRTVVPFGGRKSLVTGKPATVDVGLDMTSNSGVISYAPADLTLSVKAGTTWADLQATLAEQGQTLPIDVPHPDKATVGGVVATGFAGARKFRQGSLRDLLIGCEFVRGDGLVARAGGMVVKNVSGFEIPRFLHGSWGSLAVITSVNLKVVPIARAEATVLQTFDAVAGAVQAGLSLAQTGLPLDAIAVVASQDRVVLATRCTGRERAVNAMAAELISVATGDSSRLDGADSANWWQATTDDFAGVDSVMQLAVSVGNEALPALAKRISELSQDARILVLPGSGSLRVQIGTKANIDPAATFTAIADLVRSDDGSWVIEAAPESLRVDVDVWGDADSGHATMTSIKRTFDPGQVLNRGRLFI